MVERTLRPQPIYVNIPGRIRSGPAANLYRKLPKMRDEALDHIILWASGLENDHSLVIANELGVNLKQTSGPIIEKAGNLVAILGADLETSLFIDRFIARQWKRVLYSAMEDFGNIMIGAGEGSRSVHLDFATIHLDWGYDTCRDALKSSAGTFGITGPYGILCPLS